MIDDFHGPYTALHRAYVQRWFDYQNLPVKYRPPGRITHWHSSQEGLRRCDYQPCKDLIGFQHRQDILAGRHDPKCSCPSVEVLRDELSEYWNDCDDDWIEVPSHINYRSEDMLNLIRMDALEMLRDDTGRRFYRMLGRGES